MLMVMGVNAQRWQEQAIISFGPRKRKTAGKNSQPFLGERVP